MNKTSLSLAAAAISVLADGATHAQDKFVFAYIEEPPFAATVNGQPSGSDIEVAKTVLARMGIKNVEFVKTEFAELLPGVAAGRWTMNTGLFVTQERCKTVAFSNPIWALVDGMIVRAGNPKGISSYASVGTSGARIGLVRNTIQIGYAKAAGVPVERIVEFNTQDEAVAAVKAGQVDAFAATALGNRALLASLNDPDLAIAQPFEPPVVKGAQGGGFGAYSFNKANSAFVARFNAELATFLGSEEHRSILARYGFGSDEITPTLMAKSEDLCK